MFFTRTCRYQSPCSVQDLKNRLLEDHVKVDDVEFAVTEKEQVIKISPNTDSVEETKPLPVTYITLEDKGRKTKVVLKSKIEDSNNKRSYNSILFCAMLFLATIIFFIFGKEEYASVAYIFSSISLLVFIIFWARMEASYFDYIRKVRDHIKNLG